ncbi:MAG: M23 family metallopeptidase [Acidobacteria bacterium]|nr:M23 family metallopeptidase [Acidobacteriota bacterium]
MKANLAIDVTVDFPLRGEWWAVQTPAQKVPSHGTDFFAQRYAFDFARMDPSGTWFYPGEIGALLRHLSIGLPASQFFCWDQAVHASFAGRVLAARDGWPDRTPVVLPWELLRTHFTPSDQFRDRDYRPLAGNFAIIEGHEGVAFYAHLKQGSLSVRADERVSAGDVVGAVGNSGNSTMPHLHFHLMDGADPLAARALSCAFRAYERWVDGSWEPVDAGVPGRLERIRAV